MTPRSRTWLDMLAYEERTRFVAMRAGQAETALRLSRERDVALNDLQNVITRDVNGFVGRLPAGSACSVSVESSAPAGFVVRRTDRSGPAITMTVRPVGASIECVYEFAASNGTPSRTDRLELMFGDTERARRAHAPGDRTGLKAEALSAHLLQPIFKDTKK